MRNKTRLLVIGMAIDILKWTREPIYRVQRAVKWLVGWRVAILVRLQFNYHELSKRNKDQQPMRKGTRDD